MPVLNAYRLKQLKQASGAEDWTAAADICLELSLKSKGTRDEFYVEEMATAVQRKDTEWLEFIIDQVTA